jgi:hypothetical protein
MKVQETACSTPTTIPARSTLLLNSSETAGERSRLHIPDEQSKGSSRAFTSPFLIFNPNYYTNASPANTSLPLSKAPREVSGYVNTTKAIKL